MNKLKRFTGVLGCAVALVGFSVAQAAPAPFQVEVLDTLQLGKAKTGDLKILELSGLAYDQASKHLHAVSDKGRLFSFKLDVSNNKIAKLEPVSGHTLVDAKGAAMRDQGFNAEDIALDTDGTFVIVSETGPRIARFNASGIWQEDLTVPAALRDPAAQRSEKDGLESVALHPELGLLTAPEEPLTGQTRTTHTLYAADGKMLAYDTTEIGSTSIKAMTVLQDGRLMLLERDRASDRSLITWLRTLDPAQCKADALCPTEVAKVEVPAITDANFEGIADLSNGLFMIVSDDKIDQERRSIFALLKVSPAPAK